MKDLNIFEMVQPVPYKNQLKDDGYVIWCGSYIKTDDGKYHVYYARWKAEYGHESWVSYSEIAHSVSDNIDGPYVFSDIVLPMRERKYWDGAMTHNPYMVVHGGKYYLYYIGTTAPETVPQFTGAYDEDWWQFRNRQQIGVAVSESPYGPWERFDEPVLKPTTELNSDGTVAWDSMAVTNPAIAIGENGKVVMLYKAIEDTTEGDKTKRNGAVKFGVATADNPLAPFVKSPELIFTNPDDLNDTRMLAEDPFVWYSKKESKYMALTRDNTGIFTGDKGSIVLFESIDGVHNWKPSKHPLVLKSKFIWEDGKKSLEKLERPWLLFDEDEKPIMLFGATGITEKRAYSTNVFIPLK